MLSHRNASNPVLQLKTHFYPHNLSLYMQFRFANQITHAYCNTFTPELPRTAYKNGPGLPNRKVATDSGKLDDHSFGTKSYSLSLTLTNITLHFRVALTDK